MPLHTGEVYLDGKSLYEMDSLEAVLDPKVFAASQEPEASLYQWYTCQEGGDTLIYANFQGADPREHLVEINVRRNCFYPSRTGIGYITLSGFTVRQAATTWAPPTAYQEGMVGPHWSKGWIIEDCEISDSKCCGISLGKYLQPNNENKWVTQRLKQGTQTERDAILQAQVEGWTKENIGSHIVRRCNIHHCEQCGIVGHLGGVFSLIEDNHIHHINNKVQLAGAEIGGIKMHAAIDVVYRRNHIHHCTRGLWLDWQAQGTRVTQNLFHDNGLPLDDGKPAGLAGEDLFVEVSHGPTLVDNNLFLSPVAGRLATQGVAYVHNLICGSFTSVSEGTDNGQSGGPRYTPYHIPHRTEVAGFMTFLHGDNRFYNNLFIQRKAPLDREDINTVVGTVPFNDYPTPEEWHAMFFLQGDVGSKEDRAKYYAKMPVTTSGNVYFNGAVPCDKEENCQVVSQARVHPAGGDGWGLQPEHQPVRPAALLPYPGGLHPAAGRGLRAGAAVREPRRHSHCVRPGLLGRQTGRGPCQRSLRGFPRGTQTVLITHFSACFKASLAQAGGAFWLKIRRKYFPAAQLYAILRFSKTNNFGRFLYELFGTRDPQAGLWTDAPAHAGRRSGHRADQADGGQVPPGRVHLL